MAEPDLGQGPCSDATTQCADSNTVCVSNKCTCSATHYDDNGATTVGGSCVQSKYLPFSYARNIGNAMVTHKN